MKFAKEGYIPAALPAVAAAVAGITVGWMPAAMLFALSLAVLSFFRDPEREPEGGVDAIVSPADGRVVRVVTDGNGHKLDENARQCVSIFMSPLNVHVNRMPAAGKVEKVVYAKGQFKAAYAEDASEVNESSAMLVRARDGYQFIVVQIAGWLARRIICKVDHGDVLGRGERFGLIMFGSRVDVYLPETVGIIVKPGDRVAAGRSVIARYSVSDELKK